MSERDKSGPAFPCMLKYKQFSGMSLRDWFAANAPEMPKQWHEDTKGERLPKGTHYVNALVSWGYFYADAMLAARGEPVK